MGASVRIEDFAFADMRFKTLAGFCGLSDADHARKDGAIVAQCTIEGTHFLSENDIEQVLGKDGAKHLVNSRLGELEEPSRVRIKGTAGRIEWLKTLRSNGQYGKLGGRPTKKGRRPKPKTQQGYDDRNPHGFEKITPTTPTPTPVPSPVLCSSARQRVLLFPQRIKGMGMQGEGEFGGSSSITGNITRSLFRNRRQGPRNGKKSPRDSGKGSRSTI